MALLPHFLLSFENFIAHLDDIFQDSSSNEKGSTFASFAERIASLVPEFENFGPAESSKKVSHDEGVDFSMSPTADEGGAKVWGQAKFRIRKKEEFDTIISKFAAWDRKQTPVASDLFTSAATSDQRYTVVTASQIESIIALYEKASLPSFEFYSKLRSSGRLTVVDGPRIFALVKAAYEKAFSIPGSLAITASSPWVRTSDVNVGFVSASEIIRLYRDHGDALFFENIREFLGVEASRSADKISVNQKIVESAMNEPEKFLGRNNGITFKATRVECKDTTTLTLFEGSVVNGCQTTRCLVSAADKLGGSLDNCLVQVKVVISEQAWDVASAANYQNQIDQLDLEIARYVRPQLVRKHSVPFGASLSDLNAKPIIEVLNALYETQMTYEEVKLLFVGLFSNSPINISYKNYARVDLRLVERFVGGADREESLFDFAFTLINLSNDAIAHLSERFSDKDYMQPFLRIFKDRKEVYRVYFSMLTAAALSDFDFSKKPSDRDEAERQLADCVDTLRQSMKSDADRFRRTYASAVLQFCQIARSENVDDDKIRPRLANYVRGDFSNALKNLKMYIDMGQVS